LYASVGAALLVTAGAREAIAVFAPASYGGATPVVALLSLYYATLFFGKLPQLMFAKKTHQLSMHTLFSLGLNVVCCVTFTRAWGAPGAAAGTLVAGVLSTVAYVALGHRAYPIRWRYGPLSAMFGLLVAAVAVVMLEERLGVPRWIGLGGRAALVAVYVWLGTRLGVLTRGNIDLVVETFRQRLGRKGLSAVQPRAPQGTS
jgi:O-antigen/teichoic acid export membrane protein